MHLSQALYRISTNVRFLTGSLLLPEHAAALAERLFLTPPRRSDASRLPESTFFDFLDAHASYVEYRGRNLASWRWGPLEERRRNGLVVLHDLLAGTPIHRKYWIIMGLLLGCVRDGGPIKWDRDADFGFLERDLPHFLAAAEVLRSRGFSLRPRQLNNDGSVTKWAFKRQGVKYEFFMFLERGDRLRWIYHSRKLQLELINELPRHELDEFELYGRRWLKPARPPLQRGARIRRRTRYPHPSADQHRRRHLQAGHVVRPPGRLCRTSGSGTT